MTNLSPIFPISTLEVDDEFTNLRACYFPIDYNLHDIDWKVFMIVLKREINLRVAHRIAQGQKLCPAIELKNEINCWEADMERVTKAFWDAMGKELEKTVEADTYAHRHHAHRKFQALKARFREYYERLSDELVLSVLEPILFEELSDDF